MEAITLSIAVLGAVLGLINTWYNIDKSRVKLKVRPANVYPINMPNIYKEINFCIEVTNLSSFPVTVSEVGFLYSDTKARDVIINPIIIDGREWPRRLEPRSSVTCYIKLDKSIIRNKIKCAYAKTQCGVIKTGKSPSLKYIKKGGIYHDKS
ncbi:hypothetical protein [Thermodesulfovibrio yellowstonii]|uniref:Uncharacterized protein n=1 Tax=Thermodesulfovibrio yellowstonii TaxID=28262 RepID=A0A9W6LK81_9BACT|nr:hypothetical protein [Thermodesulfovibrio islandicus]GLI53344.1 hypothetical protein TISLANDTSLP1_10370 [Thermodesulfovibrio islandicus]